MIRTVFAALVALALPAAPLAQGGKDEARPGAESPKPKEKASKAAPKGELYVTFVTSEGKIGARLLPEAAPNGVKNFVDLATGKKEWTDPRTNKRTKAPLYDGTVFHRVIPDFMIQGGDPLGLGVAGPGYSFPDELKAGEKPFDRPCQVAYANSGPDTNGSQFFVTEVPTPHLNPRPCTTAKSGVCGYVHFGEGVCGCELVRKIAVAGNGKTTLQKVVVSKTRPTCK